MRGQLRIKAFISINPKSLSAIFTLAIYLLSLFSALFPRQLVQAAAPPAVSSNILGLSIEPIAAYNLIVDSNVLSPSSYGPSAATLGAKFCNTSDADLTNVWGYIGDYIAGTPGTYPVRLPNTITENTGLSDAQYTDFGGPVFSLEHESGTLPTAPDDAARDRNDASRYIGTLKPGECRTQYWLISYPRKAWNGSSWEDVTGGVKPADDLWLEYNFWATAASASGPVESYARRYLTMRNEISAMANKIWPNGDNKVPEVYRKAIASVVGWDTITPSGTSTVYPGQTVTSQGIWYDFGNVGAGFDNNLDFVPDRNAWVQPIGDHTIYDPGCFRLVRTYGLVIVKLNNGTEQLIPFLDRLYFENLPANNTGVVGLVYYEYVSLDGACTANLTPYQEVASGYDNEKFNGDFGAGIPPLQSKQTNMTFAKTGAASVQAGGEIHYSMMFRLPADGASPTLSIGNIAVGLPLVFRETIPPGTTYKAGSAAFDTTAAPPITTDLAGKILYSHDHGVTWSDSETPANTVTHIEWWLDSAIYSQDATDTYGGVKFTVLVPGSYTEPVVEDTGCLKFGLADCFLEDTHTTLVTGTYQLSGIVFQDDGGTNGTRGDGIKNGDEAGIGDSPADPDAAGVTVWLYWDANGDKDAEDAGDFLLATTTTDASGNYSFTNLPAGSYITRVDVSDNQASSPVGDIPAGYGLTTSETKSATLSSTTLSVTGLNFGFSPALQVTKQLATTTPVYVGDTVNFRLSVGNTLPGSGEATDSCKYKVYASIAHTDNTLFPPGGVNTNGQWKNTAMALGPGDELYAYTSLSDNSDLLGLSGFTIGNLGGVITKVEFALSIHEKTNLKATDDLFVRIFYNNNTIPIHTSTFAGDTYFTGAAGTEYNPVVDLTSLRTWTWDDFTNNLTEMQLEGDKGSGGGDSGDIELDYAAFIITTSGSCGGSGSVLNPVELKDYFDPNYLSYISASLPPSSVSGGTITWDNLGPLYPGQYRGITVSFRALLAGTTINRDESLNSYFSSGIEANDDPQTQLDNQAAVTIAAAPTTTGTISGVIWDDDNNDGWPSGSTTGYSAINDSLISDARVNLYACKNNLTGNLVTDTGNITSCAVEGGSWVLIATTYSNAAGEYSFNALRTGFYRVVVDAATIVGNTGQTGDVNEKTGLCVTCDNQSNTTDQDMDSAAFLIQMGNPGYTFTNINFGYRAPDTSASEIGDLLFFDWNGDGIRDPGNEEGIANITVYLYDLSGDLVGTDQTDGNGEYLFPGLPAGIYTVRLDTTDLPTGLVQTLDPDTNGVCVFCDHIGTASVDGTLAGSDYTLDFAYKPTGTGSIGDTVYKDLNSNGIKDGTGETGIPGVTVQLQVSLDGDTNYVTIATDLTDTNGAYLFENLPVGDFYNYRVVITLTAANQAAIPDDAFGNNFYYSGDGTLNSISNPSFLYHAAPITSANPNNLDVDFGFAPPASIGDTVYYDLDGDGQQDWNEPGIPGVTVTLYTFTDSNNNRRYDPEEIGSRVAVGLPDTTDANGNYSFNGLLPYTAENPGLYAVVVTPPAGTTLTGDPNMDGVACPASSGQPLCDHTEGMRLYPGSVYVGADFGYQPLGGFFGDYIWLDANGNGLQDASETGLSGVTVTATTTNPVVVNGVTFSDGTELTTITDADGRYNFGLVSSQAGSAVWTVEVGGGLPVGVTQTYDPDGALDNSTTVSIDTAGIVTSVGGVPCLNCAYNADFGYRYPSGDSSISGTICMDFTGGNQNDISNPNDLIGICGDVTTYQGVGINESAFGGVQIYLYRFESIDNVVQASELTLYQTTISSNSGDYRFDNVYGDASARYVVVFNSPQANLELTTMTGDQLAINSGAPSIVVESNPSPALAADTQVYQIVTTPNNATIQNVDFAFQSTIAYDYGDLPDNYSTTLSGTSDGARHTYMEGLYLGSTPPDLEENGQPSVTATLDDGSTNEEDGVQLVDSIWNDREGSVAITLTGTGYLVGWIDFNKNGSFADAGEMIVNQIVHTTDPEDPIRVTFPTPAVTSGSYAARFRLFASAPLFPSLAYSGAAVGGEVEDYYFVIVPTAVTLYDFMAGPAEGGVRLMWSTATEIDNLGFSLYRRPAQGGDFELLTPDLIPSQAPGQIIGADYEWLDATADPQASYVYRLDALDISGSIQQFEASYQPVNHPSDGKPFKIALPVVTR